VPELGRSRKSDIAVLATTLDDLAAINPADHLDAKGKTGIPNIGEKRLMTYTRRAKLLTSGSREPVILECFDLLQKPIEVYFDIEADPTQDIVYLHGVVERRNGDNSTRKFYGFTAHEVSNISERDAWAEFWAYIRQLPADEWAMYYYSKYERTQYRRLAQKFPDVASEVEVEWLFDTSRSIDLYYDIVKSKTEWPAYNQSVKTLAQHLGFAWRDPNPSGAASIQWFNEYCEAKDPVKLQRILDYNEDDCVAMIWVKDKLATLL
jgi:predicted RecB family nuclease